MKMRGIKNIFLYSLIIVLVSAFCGSITFAATLDELNKQKNQLSQDITNLQNAAENKEKEAQTLSKQISNIENDIKSTENKIETTGQSLSQTQTEIDALNGQIDTRKKELELLKKKLNASLVEIYRSSMKSEYELILGATSLSQSSNEKNYLQAVEGQVKILHTKVNEAKTTLETQKSDQEKKKAELEELKKQQEAYRQSVAYQKTTKDKLLNMTVAQQDEYLAKVEKLKKEVNKVSVQIYAERQRLLNGNNEVVSGGGSGYPYSSIDEPDPWFFLTRECTSYAAWYWNIVLGKNFVNTRIGSGSAWNWPSIARDQGYSVSSTPRVGAIISWGITATMPYGHVAIVEAVNGNSIDVSEYNYIKPGYIFSYRSNVNPENYGSYSYIY
jgi:surface antigen